MCGRAVRFRRFAFIIIIIVTIIAITIIMINDWDVGVFWDLGAKASGFKAGAEHRALGFSKPEALNVYPYYCYCYYYYCYYFIIIVTIIIIIIIINMFSILILFCIFPNSCL